MSKKGEEMKKRYIADPLHILNGQRQLGDSADEKILPFLVHFEEVKSGHCHEISMRTVTVYIGAMLSCVNNTATKRNETLIRYIADAGKAWISCCEKSCNAGIDDKMIIDDEALSIISRAVRVFLVVMPQIKVYVWDGAIKLADGAWQRRVDSVQRAC